MSVLPAKILLATDGSEDAQLAACSAVGLAKVTNSELYVVTVGEEYPSYDAYRPLAKRSRQLARNLLDKQVSKIEEIGGTIRKAYLKVGRADREVVELAEEVGAGLVVVGSRGLGAVRRTLLGSVSISVLHHAHCSVLVVRGHDREKEREYVPGRILLAFDGSQGAIAAARTATQIAAAAGSEVHILYVVLTEPYPQPLEYASLGEAKVREMWEANLGWEEERIQELMKDQARHMKAEGVKVVETHLLCGKPEREVVELAEELDADLVVMGSRGLGGLRRVLLGNVSTSVVCHAHCPVLIVREGPEETV